MTALFKAATINDDEVQLYLMQSFVDIARCNYDYLESHISNLGNLTLALVNSDKIDAATTAIEFWTSLCEVEIERNSKG